MRKLKYTLILILLLSLTILTPVVFAYEVPYPTYTYNPSKGGFVLTQDAYLPLSIQYSLGNLELYNPQDISIDQENNIYIADFNKVSANSSLGQKA